MPIDPAGVKPGLVQSPDSPVQHHIKCKREGCDSILAIEIKIPNSGGRHLYQCVKCHTTWGINTGGGIDLG